MGNSDFKVCKMVMFNFMLSVVCLLSLFPHDSVALPKVWGVPGSSPSYPRTPGTQEPEYPEPAKYQETENPEPAKYQEPQYPEQTKFEEPEYPEPKYPQPEYPEKPEYPEESGYDLQCETYYDYEFADKCVDYYDKVCYTKYEEHCDDVTRDKCHGVIKTEQVRKCLNVTELLCGLVETVKYEMATASYTVQKCHKAKERVCDTVYEAQTKTRDDYHCINIKAYKCYNTEKTLYDKTCRHVTKYNCDTYNSAQYNNADYAYGNSGGYEDQYSEPECEKSVENKCYETPRAVQSLECSDSIEKVCEKFPENVPYAGEKQACHDEEKRVCELEEKKQPKQIKKYVYKKQCKKVPRQICSSADVKTLKPTCHPTTYKNCYYKPQEQCEQVPKTYCYKVPKKIAKQRCHKKYETSYEEPNYAEPAYDKYTDNAGYKPEPTYE